MRRAWRWTRTGRFLAQLQGKIAKRGTVEVLRHGIQHGAHSLELFYGTLLPGNRQAAERFAQNRFSVVVDTYTYTIGPVWCDAGDEEALLAACYRNSFARTHTASIAFPAISTGVYGFPPDRAARIAGARAHGTGFVRIVFACFDEATDALYRRQLSL